MRNRAADVKAAPRRRARRTREFHDGAPFERTTHATATVIVGRNQATSAERNMSTHPLPDGSARKLFGEALQRPVGERPGFVRHACGSNEALRHQVEELLVAYQEAESAFPDAASGEQAGARPAGAKTGRAF